MFKNALILSLIFAAPVAAQTGVIQWAGGSNNVSIAPVSGGTVYAPLMGNFTMMGSTTEGVGTRHPVSVAGAMSALDIHLSSTPTSAYVCTLFLNGSATALTCTSSGTACQDFTNSVSVSSGDEVGLQCIASGGSQAKIIWSVRQDI